MWRKVLEKFEKYPSQIAVVQEFLKIGVAIRDGKAYCGNIELVPAKIAEAVGVDRKVVVAAIQNIERDEELRKVFSNLKPVANIVDVAQYLGFGVLEVYAESHRHGIAAGVTAVLSKEGIVIRFMLAEDPEISVESKMVIVTDRKVPGKVVEEILRVDSVKKVVVS